MSTKQKIIDALGCALDDISEDRLLDILLDAYAAKKDLIIRLVREVDSANDELYREHERMEAEQHRMRSDPLYCLSGGRYYFATPGGATKYMVLIEGRRVELVQKHASHELMLHPISMEQWFQ